MLSNRQIGTENILVGARTGLATAKLREILNNRNIPYSYVCYDDNKAKMIELNIRTVPVLLVFVDGMLTKVMNFSEVKNGTV
jgi:hypothetical protein